MALCRILRTINPVFNGADGRLVVGLVSPLYRALEDLEEKRVSTW